MHLRINPTSLTIKLTTWLKDQILSKRFLAEEITNVLYNVSIEKLDPSLKIKIHSPILLLWFINQPTHFVSLSMTRLILHPQRLESVTGEQFIMKKLVNLFHGYLALMEKAGKLILISSCEWR